MNNLSREIFLLSEIASSIALDNFKFLDKRVQDYKLKKYSPRKLYECILQSYLFCGFPSAIESLRVFRRYYKDFKTLKRKYNLSHYIVSGKINCKLIYKNNYKKLIENMINLSPDLKDWMIIEGYGKVLSRKGLSLIEREYINVAILCSRYFEIQLYSHLKGCLHLGASKNDLTILIKNLESVIKNTNIKRSIRLINKL